MSDLDDAMADQEVLESELASLGMSVTVQRNSSPGFQPYPGAGSYAKAKELDRLRAEYFAKREEVETHLSVVEAAMPFYSGGVYVLIGDEFNVYGTVISYDLVNNEATISSPSLVTGISCTAGLGVDGYFALIGMPIMETFDCQTNAITELDFTDCVGLKFVYCKGNLLDSVSFSGCTSELTVDLSDNSLAELDISDLLITDLNLKNNLLVQEAVDDILYKLALLTDATPGTCDMSGTGNEEPSASYGWANYDVLVAGGWTISVNGVHP